MKEILITIVFMFLFVSTQAQDTLKYKMLNYKNETCLMNNHKTNKILKYSYKDNKNIKIDSTIGYVTLTSITLLTYYNKPENVKKENKLFHYGFIGVFTGCWLTIQIKF